MTVSPEQLYPMANFIEVSEVFAHHLTHKVICRQWYQRGVTKMPVNHLTCCRISFSTLFIRIVYPGPTVTQGMSAVVYSYEERRSYKIWKQHSKHLDSTEQGRGEICSWSLTQKVWVQIPNLLAPHLDSGLAKFSL